jgi:tRNA-(ms[2]io[6]A)-hydroxylase
LPGVACTHAYAAQLDEANRAASGSFVSPGDFFYVIEARSCERFKLLGDVVKDDRELQKLYRGLWAFEHGHYLSFLHLAEQILPSDIVERRWNQMLDAEAKIIRAQEPGPRMHSGM